VKKVEKRKRIRIRNRNRKNRKKKRTNMRKRKIIKSYKGRIKETLVRVNKVKIKARKVY
jgi:hypothetical protein